MDFIKCAVLPGAILFVVLLLISIINSDNQQAEAAGYQSYNPTHVTNQILERQANTLERIAVALEKIAGSR